MSTPVTREVWLVIGDSEAAGVADPTLGPAYDASGLYMFRGSGWEPLAEPTAVGSYPPVGLGPAGMFGALRRLACGLPEVGVVNVAVGSTTSTQWLPGGALYATALARGRAASTTPGCRLGGVLVFSGANDATQATPSWGVNTRATLAALRAELGPFRCVVTRCCETVPTDTEYPGWAVVRGDQLAVSADPGNIGVQAPEGPWREAYRLHLDGAGNMELASRYASAVVI